MMAFPGMISEAAIAAGMKVPDDPDNTDFEAVKEQYPHWFVYCCLQLGRSVTWGNHWENAKIIARVPLEKLKKMTEADFYALGFDP